MLRIGASALAASPSAPPPLRSVGADASSPAASIGSPAISGGSLAFAGEGPASANNSPLVPGRPDRPADGGAGHWPGHRCSVHTLSPVSTSGRRAVPVLRRTVHGRLCLEYGPAGRREKVTSWLIEAPHGSALRRRG